MNQNRKLPKLSEREEDVMAVFWKTDKAMTAVQVAEESEHLKLNTVKPVVQKLLQKNFIEVAGIVHSGPSIARTYNYVVSAEEYAADQLQAMRSNSFSFFVSGSFVCGCRYIIHITAIFCVRSISCDSLFVCFL